MTARSFRRLVLIAAILVVAPAVSPGQQPATQTAEIHIDATQTAGTISPLLYGQFLEFMFEGIKGGLSAELVRDRGFEEAPNVLGLPRYWERYPDDRDDDYALTFAWDDSVSYPERVQGEDDSREHSLRVDAGRGVIPRHGIFQPRMPVRAGVEYRGSVWIRTTGYTGAIVIALESDVLGGDVYAEDRIESIRGGWTRYKFQLTPKRADPLARLVISFEGQGRVWLDQVSLMPGDAVGGVRRDVFERIEALHPAFIRWPGGNVAQDYHWRWAIGPRDERRTWINHAWRRETEPSDFGTDEFIAFCRRVGAEPSITVNVEGRGASAAEAAAWVEYCDGPAASKNGAQRAANGHPEPFGVKYWEVGNEIFGDWVRGHSDAATYVHNLNRYAAAMRAVDPSIKLIAVGAEDPSWNREVLRTAGQVIDFLAIHHYYGRREMRGDVRNLLAHPLHYERFYHETAKLIRELVPDRPAKLAINEWGLDLPLASQYSIDAALYGARLMNVFERMGDVVGTSAVSDLVNGWPGGIIQSGRHGVFVTPIYLVNQLYAAHLGRDRLETKVVGPTFDTSREGQSIPVLDATASRTADGKQIIVKVVNTDRDRPVVATLDVAGARLASPATIETVVASGDGAVVGFATPDAVSVRRTRIEASPTVRVELPKASVTVLTLRVIR